MKMNIENGTKKFDNKVILKNINIIIGKNSFTSIIGESGMGKTTLLRVLAGLESLDSGTVYLNGIPEENPGTKRIVVFQTYDQLFPWLTVVENVIFPLRIKKESTTIVKRVFDIVERVGLKEYSNFYPNALSGGMKQRVAIARALFAQPEVLLMDEPFSSLDLMSRKKLQKLILELWEECGLTIVMVTHNVNEAVLLSNKIYCLKDGQVDSIKVEIERPRSLNSTLEITNRLTELYF